MPNAAQPRTIMTGAELKKIRHDLGDAINRRLSTADMAKLCGLAPKNGADIWRNWEESDGPSGPVAALVSILAYASDRYDIPQRVTFTGFSDANHTIDKVFRDMIREEILMRLDASDLD